MTTWEIKLLLARVRISVLISVNEAEFFGEAIPDAISYFSLGCIIYWILWVEEAQARANLGSFCFRLFSLSMSNTMMPQTTRLLCWDLLDLFAKFMSGYHGKSSSLVCQEQKSNLVSYDHWQSFKCKLTLVNDLITFWTYIGDLSYYARKYQACLRFVVLNESLTNHVNCLNFKLTFNLSLKVTMRNFWRIGR